MQLFKDKQLRADFEEFKKTIFQTVVKLNEENETLIEENKLLKEECNLLNKRLDAHEEGFEHKLRSISTEKNGASKTSEKPLEYGGNTINKDAQKTYKSLSFDGFWFKTSRGKNASKNIINIHQLILLWELQNKNSLSWKELGEEWDIPARTLQKLAFNILNGNFDKYYSQYQKTTFSFKKDGLWINNKLTKLSLSDVKEIVTCYVNDKSEKTIHKLIKSYPKTKQEYIMIICDNYDSLRLKKHISPINVENNPQKRKEKGMI